VTESPAPRAARALVDGSGLPPAGSAFAPGRVNLIGEHVDHQGGLVLPMALSEGVHVAWAPRHGRDVRFLSCDTGESGRFEPGTTARDGRGSLDLVRHVAAALRERGVAVRGTALAAASDLPLGAGLASSAAFVVAIAKALFAASGAPLPATKDLALLAQEVETRCTGVRCGWMDPYVAAAGEPGEPMLLDCAALTHETLPAPREAVIAWHDSGVRRTLADTPYNARRAEIEEGLARVREARPEVCSLRDLSLAAWKEIEARVPDPARRRVRHVVTEMDRVRRAAEALRSGDASTLGAILDEGHRSLADDFEASRPDLEAMRDGIRAQPEVLGVRLQGAGWGGCFVVLCRAPGDGARGGSRTLNALAGTGS
jgi:galactokinase